MTEIPSMTITPSAAARAYARTDSGGAGFGATLQQAMQNAVETGHQADQQAMHALTGGGNLTDVVTALSRAELTLQSATAIRDRVVQAYQDIIRMPI
jgi:flagellar hook-basal body complex protein FliE